MEQFTARANARTVPISVVTQEGLSDWLSKQQPLVSGWLKGIGFAAEPGRMVLVPTADGGIGRAVLGVSSPVDTWSYAALPSALPAGRYAFDESSVVNTEEAYAACLGWALGTYRFTRYKTSTQSELATLVWPKSADSKAVTRVAEAMFAGRDLINTPAEDLGPAELADAVSTIGNRFGAKTKVITGKQLLEKNFPLVYAVGRAATAARAPRLIDLRWGSPKAPKVTLVGKGIVFDTGGLDIKPSQAMRTMKKDMGGSATVIAVAQMIMEAKLPVRLRLLVAAAENAVSSDSFRPGDILTSRKGLTIEVGNTDAEGRLVLADALTEAASEEPELIADFATLTGASRVALGTELPGLYCTDDALAAELVAAGDTAHDYDPLWRMPLFSAYRQGLDSPIADLCNISNQSYGGAITAALFLREFVGSTTPWIHVDTMAWYLAGRPGRPVGGEVMGARAMFRLLAARYSS